MWQAAVFHCRMLSLIFNQLECIALPLFWFFWLEGYEWSGREKPATWSVITSFFLIVCKNNSPKAGCTNLLKPQSSVGNKASSYVTSAVKWLKNVKLLHEMQVNKRGVPCSNEITPHKPGGLQQTLCSCVANFLAKRSTKDVKLTICNGVATLKLQPNTIEDDVGLTRSHRKFSVQSFVSSLLICETRIIFKRPSLVSLIIAWMWTAQGEMVFYFKTVCRKQEIVKEGTYPVACWDNKH